MSAEERIELFQDIIEDSKRFEFVEDDVLNVKDYYTSRKSININFTKLIEILYEYDIDDCDIEELLLTDEEQEGDY